MLTGNLRMLMIFAEAADDKRMLLEEERRIMTIGGTGHSRISGRRVAKCICATGRPSGIGNGFPLKIKIHQDTGSFL